MMMFPARERRGGNTERPQLISASTSNSTFARNDPAPIEGHSETGFAALSALSLWRFPGETARGMNRQIPHNSKWEDDMMRANAVLSVSGLVLASGAAVVFIGLSVAHAQAPSGKVLQATGSPLAASRPLSTPRQPAPPLYCLTRTAACDNTQRVREGEKCSCPGTSGLGLVRRYEER
jgi:hypothetical protein